MPRPSRRRRLHPHLLPFIGNRPCTVVPYVHCLRFGLHSVPFAFQAMSGRLFEALALYLVLSLLFKD
jgi:hypothetical protein